MHKTIHHLLASAFVCAAALLPLAAQAQTPSFTVDYAPGAQKGPDTTLVKLIPNPAVQLTFCPWVKPAAQKGMGAGADAQAYNKVAKTVWNFNFGGNLTGT